MVVMVIVDSILLVLDDAIKCHLQHSWFVLLGIQKDLFHLPSGTGELSITTQYSICIKKSDSFDGL